MQKRRLAIFAALFGALFFPTTALSAFGVLHSFAGPEGETPAAPLVQGADGFFYGVAAHGGDFTVLPPDGGGTAFRMDAKRHVTTLHTFRGPEGAWPKSLIQGRDGFFYGTATLGGQPSITNLNPGVGTIFRMDSTGAGDRAARLPALDRRRVFSARADRAGRRRCPLRQCAGSVRDERHRRVRLSIRSGHRRLPPPA